MLGKTILLIFQDRNLHRRMPFSTLPMKEQQLHHLLRLWKEDLSKEDVESSGTTERSTNASWPSLLSILAKRFSGHSVRVDSFYKYDAGWSWLRENTDYHILVYVFILKPTTCLSYFTCVQCT